MNAVLFDMGVVEYGQALELQRSLAEKRARDEVGDALLLLEHPHVITLGRKTSPENLGPQGVPVFSVERGGDATYHGPGQLVGYPIMKLRDHDVRRHVKAIEKALVNSVGRFGIEAGTLERHPGIWVGGKKLASIGVAVKDWVTFHGFALNVNTDLSYFNLIRPCGLDPGTMTSMEALLRRRQELEAVKTVVAREFSSATGQPFVRQSLVSPALGRNIK